VQSDGDRWRRRARCCPHRIPIKHLPLDNDSLGKISKEQLAAGVPVWHTSLHNPDWAAYAESKDGM
jgi:thiamine pyrophosphate-dependent acetolactate synthase large subunit-like protein